MQKSFDFPPLGVACQKTVGWRGGRNQAPMGKEKRFDLQGGRKCVSVDFMGGGGNKLP